MSLDFDLPSLQELFLRVGELLEKPNSRLQPNRPSLVAEFRMSLCLVALGVRAGYLVDSFSPADGESSFKRLLSDLRQELPLFQDVTLVFTREYEQYFFLNMPLLRARAKALDPPGTTPQTSAAGSELLCIPSFIQLGTQESLITPAPDFISLVRGISEGRNDILTLPDDLTTLTLIPLSGFLLEYAVAYVPASPDQTIFLGGVPLDVYECTLLTKQPCAKGVPTRHTLLKFSCPAHLGGSCTSLRPDAIVARLNELFRIRLDKAGCDWPIRTTHSVVTQDRVAL
ncbi:hypothetical protein M0805_008601 [Coniferiporia weirii]|nr:hypothetical protein M0805_008601 [Coniferiporia weirii]